MQKKAGNCFAFLHLSLGGFAGNRRNLTEKSNTTLKASLSWNRELVPEGEFYVY